MEVNKKILMGDIKLNGIDQVARSLLSQVLEMEPNLRMNI
jgi:hypothetical protein